MYWRLRKKSSIEHDVEVRIFSDLTVLHRRIELHIHNQHPDWSKRRVHRAAERKIASQARKKHDDTRTN